MSTPAPATISSVIAQERLCVTAAAMRFHTIARAWSASTPDPACEVKRREGSAPRHPLPSSGDTNEGDYGPGCISPLAWYQLDICAGNYYVPVIAQGRDLECPVAQSAAPHRPIEAPPVQRPKDGRNDEIQISAERVVG
jgi:hypothetical protein